MAARPTPRTDAMLNPDRVLLPAPPTGAATNPRLSSPPRPKGKPWPVADFADHFGFTTKHARYLMDTRKVGFIRVGKRLRMVPDHEVRHLEQDGI